ncbi:hypothetical protein JXB28_03425 [Candidatus Woesearchaeota archaeon]|nr:hypothetical protein [Candidatus Woesearchaeota archaeon]
MATLLDVGLLEHFGIIFVILLVFLILFGLLEYIKAFGEGKKGMHAMIALSVAFLFLVSKLATNMVSFMVPWFMVAVIFIFLLLFLIRMFGVGEGDMVKLIKDPNAYPWIIAIAVIILLFALSNTFGQSLLEKGGGGGGAGTPTSDPAISQDPGTISPDYSTTSTATSSFATNFLNTLRNPKVLGLLFIFLVGMFALIFLTKTAK